jgi:hypothetical protein
MLRMPKSCWSRQKVRSLTFRRIGQSCGHADGLVDRRGTTTLLDVAFADEGMATAYRLPQATPEWSVVSGAKRSRGTIASPISWQLSAAAPPRWAKLRHDDEELARLAPNATGNARRRTLSKRKRAIAFRD